MNRVELIHQLRTKLSKGLFSIGSWMQIPNSIIAEIMGDSEFEWIAIDMEHGHFSNQILYDLFRAFELGNTLPLVRLKDDSKTSCKEALDAGAGGVIVPMIESEQQLINVRDNCRWPPSGKRGVAFNRANMFGKYFFEYREEAQAPLLIAMIETEKAMKNIDSIFQVEGLDAIMIGPYDLSASLGITGEFDNQLFLDSINFILDKCKIHKIPAGIHIVEPDIKKLKEHIKNKYQFIAFSIDSVLLRNSIKINLQNL